MRASDEVIANLLSGTRQIRVSWSGASTTCVQSFRLSVYFYDVLLDTDMVSGTQYDYTPKKDLSGDYIFELTSIDYLGNDVGSTNSTTFVWKEPKYSVRMNINNSIANFTFKNDDDERPPVTDCNITLDYVLKSCVMDSNIAIFNITSGVEHTYNISISNVVGKVNRNGEFSNEIVMQNVTIEVRTIDSLVTAIPFVVLGVLIVLFVCWIVLRICWKKQWCCPRIWKNSFWLIFFCYDCCTYMYEAEEKRRESYRSEESTCWREKGTDTSL
ncbi:PREDICTED: uncharacterized protein LOC109584302 [Amphimedon queenslandica]|uniref:Uncharacterized protein n=1 Tax=Amphimedon queenslandica TaxID=400682 RepID=A0AAN0JFX9_AMPQE|nr:PREDICTED: uncharacterized protein LOC109584302 [Amphimedon queenslandica]|eukprot:XP_019855548.1 PREDICTED: uncharacterized protein LOC109584302 [Amphimedon queenslandica]